MQDYESIDSFINRFETILDNAEDTPEIAAALLPFGYDAARLAEGRALLADLKALDGMQVRRYAGQIAATKSVTDALEAADKLYSMQRGIAKRLFADNPDAFRQLILHKPKATRRASWLRQSRLFYEHLLAEPELVAQMATFGQTQEKLADAQEIVLRAGELDSAQQKAKAKAQAATRERDAAWTAARKWLVTLLEVAGYALVDAPQLKEAFMQIEPS